MVTKAKYSSTVRLTPTFLPNQGRDASPRFGCLLLRGVGWVLLGQPIIESDYTQYSDSNDCARLREEEDARGSCPKRIAHKSRCLLRSYAGAVPVSEVHAEM